MTAIMPYIIIAIVVIVFIRLSHIVSKQLELFEKILKVQLIIFTPMITTLFFIDYYHTKEFLGKENEYVIFFLSDILIIILFFVARIIKRISAFYDKISWRYENFILIANILTLFSAVVTVLFFIGGL